MQYFLLFKIEFTKKIKNKNIIYRQTCILYFANKFASVTFFKTHNTGKELIDYEFNKLTQVEYMFSTLCKISV